jgi:hypothetical protein
MISEDIPEHFRGRVAIWASVTSVDGSRQVAFDDSTPVQRQLVDIRYSSDTRRQFKPGLVYVGKVGAGTLLRCPSAPAPTQGPLWPPSHHGDMTKNGSSGYPSIIWPLGAQRTQSWVPYFAAYGDSCCSRVRGAGHCGQPERIVYSHVSLIRGNIL